MSPIVKFLEADAPLIIAHRGAGGTLPENTLSSFARALEAGAEVLELDVRITRDDQLVVFHDETSDRITEAQGRVGSLSFAELQRLDAGFHFSLDGGKTFPFRGRGLKIPALEEVLRAFPGARVNVDLKDTHIRGAELLSALIRRTGAGSRVLCASFHTNVLQRFRELEPDVVTSASKGEALRFFSAFWLGLQGFLRHRYDALQVPFRCNGVRLVTSRMIRNAHRLGLAVHVWTINETDIMLHLLELGVDGIVTDFPDRLLTVRNQWMKKFVCSGQSSRRFRPGERK
ncbi:MAG: glycerophosphodiester phosphodiesterase [Deltaproteobacteria bacterium]|nr:glycerophosphodiester phosphodiesterase [Deltaproteobacteria bacterium]MBW2307254.1 glycerophosphodiester phosphodiesterase [Deltaproteobacteria bacterium]